MLCRFGRGGAALIPVLNQGKQAIADILDYAQRTGAILSGPASEGAELYAGNMAKISIAAQGAQNALMAALLPTLDYLSAMLAKTGADGKSWAQSTAESFANLAKGIVSLGDIFIHTFDQIGAVIEFVGGLIIGTADMIGGVILSLGRLFVFDFSGAKAQLEAGFSDFRSAFANFWGESKQTWSSGVDFINGVWSKLKPPAFNVDQAMNYLKSYGGSTKQAPAPTASHQPDVVAELVAKLQAEATAQLELAAATEKSTSARLLNEAAAKAQEKISETRASLMAREKELQEELNDAKAQAAAGVGSGSATGTGGPGVQAAKIEAEIAGVRKLLAELQKDAPEIKTLYAEIIGGESGAKAAKELDEFITKTNEEASAARDMAAAYSQGGAAVQQAMEAAKLAPFEKQRADLVALISALREIGAPASDVAKLQAAYDQLGSSINRARSATAGSESAKISEEIGKEKEQLAAEAKAYDVVAAAAFSSLAAQREAAAQAASIKFGAEHSAATPTDLSAVHDVELAKLNEQYQLTVRQEAAQLDLDSSYDREIEKLEAVKAATESTGESTLAVDAKIYEAQLQRIDAWDREALEVGSFTDKFRAAMNEIEIEGQNMSAKFAEQFKTAIDSASSDLAKFIVTGKGSIRQFLNSIAESTLKNTFQYGFSQLFSKIAGGPSTSSGAPGGTPGILPGPVGALAGAFGLKIPGAGAAGGPNGSAANPFYVMPVGGALGLPGGGSASSTSTAGGGPVTDFLSSIGANAGPTPPGGAAGAGGSQTESALNNFGSQLEQVFSKLISSISSMVSTLAGSIGSIASSIGGGISSGFSSFLGIFGMASGGDVSSGQPYIVGENRPEVFVPRQAGRIVPSLGQFAASRGRYQLPGATEARASMPNYSSGGGFHVTHVHVGGVHVHGVSDADSFNKSQAQIDAEMHARIGRAFSRNGRRS